MRDPRDRFRMALGTDLPLAARFRDLERLFRAIISSGVEVYLYAGGTSSSDELPNKGNEGDHEQEMDQPTGHVEHNEAE